MQNEALEKRGYPNYLYGFSRVDNTTFASAIEGLKALKMRGTGVHAKQTLACEVCR